MDLKINRSRSYGKKLRDYVIINCEKIVNQLSRQAGRQRVAVSSERKSFNISISNSIFYSGDNIHHYHYFYHFLIYEHSKWQKWMLEHLFPNAALFPHVYHKTEVCGRYIMWMRSLWLRNDFWSRRLCVEIFKVTTLSSSLCIINYCYMRAAVCIWLVLRAILLSSFRFHIKSLLFIER